MRHSDKTIQEQCSSLELSIEETRKLCKQLTKEELEGLLKSEKENSKGYV